MSDALAWLREKTKGRLLLLCGVPMGPAFKKADYCRIGNDVHPGWDFTLLRLLRAPERPSTRLSALNTLVRSPLGGRVFQNDPDVYILRTRKQRLSPARQEFLARVNHSLGAVLFTSDNPQEYKEAHSERLFHKILHEKPPAARFIPLGKEEGLIRYQNGSHVILDLQKGRMIER